MVVGVGLIYLLSFWTPTFEGGPGIRDVRDSEDFDTR